LGIFIKILFDYVVKFLGTLEKVENLLVHCYARFEVFTAVKIKPEVYWFVSPCSVVVGYKRFGDPCCLHLQGVFR